MKLHKKTFFYNARENMSDQEEATDEAFKKMKKFVDNNSMIKIINIESKSWGNGEEYILYYLDK